MPPLLFEDSIPTEFQNYHFMIRGWTPRRSERRSEFDRFIKEIAGSLPLRTEEVIIRDEVAFVCYKTLPVYVDNTNMFFPLQVQLGSTSDSMPLKKSIKRLCWCITNPSKRNHIDKVTTRSLLGISPASDHTLICWVEAIFRTALDNGPQYLENIEVKENNHIPGW